jgi:photosystem II stability/assembly factor-like uncharacterized protein
MALRAAPGIAAVVLWACAHAQAAPVAEALERPALAARHPERAVLLGAAQAAVQTGQRLVAVGERGLVVLSDDAGRTWRQAPTPVSVTLTAVRFVGPQGIAVGHGGTVLTSDDAGATWTRRLDGRQAARLVLQAAEASGDAAALRAAQQLVSDGPDKPLLDVCMLDARRALAVGAYGLALASEDGGRTWAPWTVRLDNPKGLHLYAVRARGNAIVIAGEQGLVLRSDDGGKRFSRLALPYKGSFFTLEMPADEHIVVGGLRGNLWRSDTAGATWVQLPVPAPVSITGSALRPDGSMLFVDQAGTVLAGRDGTLSPLPRTPILPPLNAVLARHDGGLLLLGVQGAVTLPAGAER